MVKVKFKESAEAFTNYFDLTSIVIMRGMQNQKATTFQDLTKSSLKGQLQVLARNYGINHHKK